MSRAPQPSLARNRSLAPALMLAPQPARALPGAMTLQAQDRQGEVRFFLQRFAGGLYVEREDIRRRGLQTSQSIFFDELGSFQRWCDEDALRFDHPALHLQLKRSAADLLRAEFSPPAGG